MQTLRPFTLASLLAAAACSGGTPTQPQVATALQFAVQPQSVHAGVPVFIQVRAVDKNGNTVTTFTGTVTIAFGANPGGGALSGPTSLPAQQGVATFSATTIDSVASGYTLAASASGLTGAVSSTFDITPGPSFMVPLLGNNLPGLAGSAVTVRPSVRITDVHGAGVSGLTVTFAVTSGLGSVSGAQVITDTGGVAQVGQWSLGSAGVNTLTASVPESGLPGNPTVFTDTAFNPGSYPITIVAFGAGLPAAAQTAFNAAAAKWEQIIYHPLPSQALGGLGTGACAPGTPAQTGSTKGVVIFASVDSIDGAGKILAEAGPCAFRSGGLAYAGVMLFDSTDIKGLISGGTLNSVILHEMGHVLGFGTAWGSCLQLASSPPGTIQDTYFGCPKAKARFDSIGGTSYTGGKTVPVENCGTSPYVYPTCGAGTVNGHWRQVAFGNELMVGFLPASPKLSVVTVASLEDIGYIVNYAAADTFTHTFTVSPVSSTPVVPLMNDIWRGPLYVGMPDGTVRQIHR